MNWLTLAVIAFILIMVLIGLKRGFIRMVLSLASLLITVILAGFLRAPVDDLLRGHTGLYQMVEGGIADFTDSTLTSAVDYGSKSTEALIGDLPLPGLIRDRITEDYLKNPSGTDTYASFRNFLVGKLTETVFTAIVYAVTFLAAFLAVTIFSLLLIHAGRLPGVKQVNSFIGAVLGLAAALCILWVGSLVVTSFGATGWGQEGLRMIDESPLLSLIYNHNPFMNTMIGKLFG